ncbi:MAG: hypothetical protein C4558_05890, partial [Dehalococcoidia bacterium]
GVGVEVEVEVGVEDAGRLVLLAGLGGADSPATGGMPPRRRRVTRPAALAGTATPRARAVRRMERRDHRRGDA